MLFLESPWPVLVLGLVAEAVLAILLIRTGRAVLLWSMGGVAIFVLAAVFIERSTVTDRKLIVQTLEGVASALASNDIKRVDTFISPSSDGEAARKKARWALSVVEFIDFTIRNLDLTFNDLGKQRTAKTTFTVIVHGKARSNDFPGEITRFVAMEVELRKENNRWLIVHEPKHSERE